MKLAAAETAEVAAGHKVAAANTELNVVAGLGLLGGVGVVAPSPPAARFSEAAARSDRLVVSVAAGAACAAGAAGRFARGSALLRADMINTAVEEGAADLARASRGATDADLSRCARAGAMEAARASRSR